MTVTGLVRTQYWNVSGANPTPRTSLTSRAESRTDVEGHLLASDAARNSALHGWGVAAGLEVSAVAGTAGVTVAQGVALDLDGHLVVLGEGGVAIVDPLVGPTGVQNIPTVPVTATGVVLDTAGLTGDQLLTITWREIEELTAGLLVLRQAPWLRLVPAAGFVDTGDQLVLAAVTIDAAGEVEDLVPGLRRLVGSPSGRLDLRIPNASAGPAVGQAPAATLAAEPTGDVVLSLLGGPAPLGALRITAGSGDARLSGGLHVAAATELAAGLTVSGQAEVIGDVSATGNLTAGGNLTLAGALAVGLGGSPAARAVHVEGTEIHSGGGGFSFADRNVASFVESPDAGQRWVWYAQAGGARLWSGRDLLSVSAGGDLSVAGVNVALGGKHALLGNDNWLRLNQAGAFPDGVHTPGCFAPGSLNVGGMNGWGNPGPGNAWITGRTTIAGGAWVSGVAVGSSANVPYPWDYETIGVTEPNLQSAPPVTKLSGCARGR